MGDRSEGGADTLQPAKKIYKIIKNFFAEISLADLVPDPNPDSNPEPDPNIDPDP